MLQTVISLLVPSGGQLRSRRNAWAAMSEAAARARARREADAAMDAALTASPAAHRQAAAR